MVRWEGSEPSGCLLVPGMLPIGILLATGLNAFFSVPWHPHGLIVIGALLFAGIVLWPVSDRYEVTVAEFTRHEVRLVSRAAVRTVPAADLTEVTVTHSGDPEEGYWRTSLRVAWREGKKTIDGPHDATLATSLSRLVAPGVEVRHVWEKPESPS
ncbi:hypothetical protein SAMN05421869_11768 [Nonomuraea jiangxiensis]|uniref:PH domain-containing protein n=2 Tax=Nonomuraea jiangxiensis TaxID=633440 RepID=A0A1G9DBA7_9ACTN|nr:hypothetical protein SAMN05421869_11768 [Nonomuraea jiangxiensis]